MRLWTTRWSRISLQTTYSPLYARRAYAAPAIPADDGWETVIGLEIHAQIKTPLKLFSRASTSYAGDPNSNVDLLDAAIPGSLPVLNRDAVGLAITTALALKCDVNSRSTFDRKHYFYHDIPSSYQITQHYNPLARSGRLPIREGESGSRRSFEVGIQQLQIEQDTAKSQVVGNDRLVDLNRAGTGLMEIVTEPDMRSPEEAGAFIKRLQGLLRRVGSGDGDMEKGSLRIDANVSVNRVGFPPGTRCEIKNLNSIRFMQQAIRSERARHISHYTSYPDVPLERETRGVNEATGETYSLRSKEDAMDYRYMPDPNLPALVLDQEYLNRLRAELPELPWETVDRMCSRFGIQQRDVETLVNLDDSGEALRYFDDVVGDDPAKGKIAMNWITQVLLGQLTKSGKEWSPTVFPVELMREMVQGILESKITNETGKTVVQHVVESTTPPRTLAETLKTLNISTRSVSTRDIRKICIDTLESLTPREQAQRDRSGNIPIGMLIGKVMARTKGQASPVEVRRVLEDLLGRSG